MAELSELDFEGKYNNSTTGLFKNNTTRDITPERVRTLVTDTKDSFMNVVDDAYTGFAPQVSTSGTNTYTATLDPAITAYANSQAFKIKFTNASSGAATLNLNGLGAKKLYVNPTTQADSGDVVDEQVYLLIYDAALDSASGGFLMIGGSGGGGASDWGDLGGNLEDQTDLYTYLRGTRTVTGADASVQTDDNAVIILNSATPFDFTLDQLTADSKISFINIGAGAVTFVNGSGVTLTGSAVLSGAIGTNYPSAVVFYHTATTPRVLNSGANDLALVTVSTAGATITLDFNNEKERMFVGSASFATAKDVEIEATTVGNALLFNLVLTITDVAAVLTFPADFTMPATDSRWNDAGKTFTVPSGGTGKYEFTASWDGTEWNMKATNQFA